MDGQKEKRDRDRAKGRGTSIGHTEGRTHRETQADYTGIHDDHTGREPDIQTAARTDMKSRDPAREHATTYHNGKGSTPNVQPRKASRTTVNDRRHIRACVLRCLRYDCAERWDDAEAARPHVSYQSMATGCASR